MDLSFSKKKIEKNRKCPDTLNYCTTVVLKNWAWIFLHTSWTLQYVSEGVLFSRLLESFASVPVFKNVMERSTAKKYHPFSLLSDFQYGSRSLRSTADLLTVVSERISRAFSRSGATWALALDKSKDFYRVWHTGLLQKRKSYGILGQIFGCISSLDWIGALTLSLLLKLSQENWSLDLFFEASFSWGCPVSL